VIQDAIRFARRTAVLPFVLLLLAAGCAGERRAVKASVPHPAFAGPRVALAPMENRTNDLDASEIIRETFGEELLRRGWSVLPTAESDRLLRENLGISYGGQLAVTTPAEVCGALGVDGVFYGEVTEWDKTTTGVYNTVSVAAFFRLYRKDGTLAWEERDRQVRVVLAQGKGRDIGFEIVFRALENLLLNPLTPYGRTVARNIAGKLPPGLPAGPPAAVPDRRDGHRGMKGGEQ
jgi:hypothetical protein